MAHIVKCKYCNKNFDADKERFEKIGNRYIHASCFNKGPQVKKDYEELTDLIKKLEGSNETDWARIGALLERWKKNGLTYKGMRMTLLYIIEIKGKPYKGIGIIPYIYEEAEKYYRKQAELRLKSVEINNIPPDRTKETRTIEITLEKPKKKFIELEWDD